MNRKEYSLWMKQQKKLASKFKLSVEDIHNLYDLTYMIDWRTMDTLKLNKIDKWFIKFCNRIENIALYDIIKKEVKKR